MRETKLDTYVPNHFNYKGDVNVSLYLVKLMVGRPYKYEVKAADMTEAKTKAIKLHRKAHPRMFACEKKIISTKVEKVK